MVVPVKFSLWFNSYINSQTSIELTADKIQNLVTKQEPEGAYNTDLHELQKNCHFFQINTFYEIAVYTNSMFVRAWSLLSKNFLSIRP